MARSMILLVSGQPMPNLLAALDPALDVSTVDLIVSGDMEVGGQAENLAKALESRRIHVTQHMVSDPFRPETTRTLVGGILKADPERFILNLTGGTKPMMLGAYRAALDHGVRDLLYLDHDSGKLHWLEGNRPPFAGRAELPASTIMQAHGYQPKSSAAAPGDDSLRFAQYLHRQLSGELLSQWNNLFHEVGKQCRSRSGQKDWTPEWVRPKVQTDNRLSEVLGNAVINKYCSWSNRGVCVDNVEAHTFLHGGWFEIVVWEALRKQQDALGIDELLLNQKVGASDGGTNELDVVARKGRKLLLLEVKTAAMSAPDGKPADILYKLESVSKAGGLTTGMCLVSLTSTRNTGKRFKGAGVGLVEGADAAPDQLGKSLAEWVRAQ